MKRIREQARSHISMGFCQFVGLEGRMLGSEGFVEHTPGQVRADRPGLISGRCRSNVGAGLLAKAVWQSKMQ
ncbi:hypothetical protein C9382_00875 [Pseudomonas aylmerensis]|uniref:Uncharacterized protein n=1 Tax=Pseudomonas aylmerensis TaxID=1869229 RepID=A0A2T4GC70_9PSED|nr:hypothetical protein BBG20_21195 [Pseudomonas aylmerensis]PTC33167.1 hypothetical protein C9382_00875 [Pseudomonas aylmerensis]